VLGFRPNVRDHDGLAVAAKTVSQEVGQLRLAVRDVVSLLVAQSQHNLLEESQRLVDE
jgi:hypothetical protein